MNERIEGILLDFVTVYLNDRKDKPDDGISKELGRLYAACEVNSTMLLDNTDYE